VEGHITMLRFDCWIESLINREEFAAH
jgi:hypothetical protein